MYEEVRVPLDDYDGCRAAFEREVGTVECGSLAHIKDVIPCNVSTDRVFQKEMKESAGALLLERKEEPKEEPAANHGVGWRGFLVIEANDEIVVDYVGALGGSDCLSAQDHLGHQEEKASGESAYEAEAFSTTLSALTILKPGPSGSITESAILTLLGRCALQEDIHFECSHCSVTAFTSASQSHGFCTTLQTGN